MSYYAQEKTVVWLEETVNVVANGDVLLVCGDESLWTKTKFFCNEECHDEGRDLVVSTPDRRALSSEAFSRRFVVSSAILQSTSVPFEDLLRNMGPEKTILLPDHDHKAMAILLHALHGANSINDDPITLWQCDSNLLLKLAALAEKYQCMPSLDTSLSRYTQLLRWQLLRPRLLLLSDQSLHIKGRSWCDLLAAAVALKHDGFGLKVVRVMLENCTGDELRHLDDDDRIPKKLSADMHLVRAKDTTDIQRLVDKAINEYIYGDGTLGPPKLAIACECGTVKKGIEAIYETVREGPRDSYPPWHWPPFFQDTRPNDVLTGLAKYLNFKVERNSNSYSCPCSRSDPDENDVISSCSCCKPVLFRGLAAEIRSGARMLLKRIGALEYEFAGEPDDQRERDDAVLSDEL